MEIKLIHRMAFPALFEPDSFADGKPMFSLKGIIEPNSQNMKLLDKTILEVATQKWGAKAPGILKAFSSDKQKMFFMKTEYCSEGGDVYDGFEDMFYFTAKNEVKPGVFDRDKSPLSQRDGRPYSGCYVVSKIDVYAQDNKWGKGMRATLLGVQFYKDGDAFSGGRAASADDFDDLSDTGEEDDDSDLA